MPSSRKSSKKHSKSRSRSRVSSRKSHTKKKLPPALKLWRQTAIDHGFMIKGNFKKMPKKGTKAYESIARDYKSAKKKAGL